MGPGIGRVLDHVKQGSLPRVRVPRRDVSKAWTALRGTDWAVPPGYMLAPWSYKSSALGYGHCRLISENESD
jgi:hypothetical protein